MKAWFLIDAVLLGAILVIIWLLFHRQRLLSALAAFSKGRLNRGQLAVTWIASGLLFLTIWDVLSRLEPEGINKVPGPVQTVAAAWRLLVSGPLIGEACISCLRVVIGFTAASIVGVGLGLAAGSFLLVNRLVVPVNSFLRYIPPTAFISLLIVYFGIGETYKYAVIFLGVIFFITQMVIDVVEDLDKRYLELALTSGFSNWRIFREVVVLSSWPRVLDVLRINLSAAWTFLVAAELIGAEEGLGHLIAVSQRYLRIDELYVGILSFGVIGVVTDRLLDLVGRRLFRWHYVRIKQ
ncbi:MAG: ABC transporter permease [Planctomycetota bacterium]